MITSISDKTGKVLSTDGDKIWDAEQRLYVKSYSEGGWKFELANPEPEVTKELVVDEVVAPKAAKQTKIPKVTESAPIANPIATETLVVDPTEGKVTE